MRNWIFKLLAGFFFIFVMTTGAPSQDASQPAVKQVQKPPVYQLVLFKLGPGWVKDKSLFAQPGIKEHSAYMSKLIQEGVLILGGPLFEDPGLSVANGAVMILAAETPEAGRKLLEADPAYRSGLLEISEIRPLMITGASWRAPENERK
jgi:uncharacterized protein YciI